MPPATHEASPLKRWLVTLADGRVLSVFVNLDTNLLVIDVIDADDEGGVEILRRNV